MASETWSRIKTAGETWTRFKTNSEATDFLKTLPRFRNTGLRSLVARTRVFFNLAYCRLFGLNRPVFVVLVVNNHCDLNCTYCYGHYGERQGQVYRDYSTARLLTLIDELWSLGTRLLTVHGGEAMLRKDIGEILNYCKLKGFYVSFNTNGYQVAQRIDEVSCVDTMVVSLDGREESNDKHRGAGNFRTALAAVDASIKARLPTVISSTLTRDNMGDMEYLAEMAAERNVRVQYSILYKPEDDAVTGFGMNDAETRATAQKILDLRRRGYPVYYEDNVLNTTIYWPGAIDKRFGLTDAQPSKKFKHVPCYHGRLKYQIDADGRVVECWATDFPDAPNIKQLGVKQALKQCHDSKKCYHCTLMANNEHNAFMHMSPRNLANIVVIQVADSLKRVPGLAWLWRRRSRQNDDIGSKAAPDAGRSSRPA